MEEYKINNGISVIGGDLRIVYLIKMLAKENIVYTYGMENCKQIEKDTNIIYCKDINQALGNSRIIITSIPISKENKYINTQYSDKLIPIEKISNNNILKNKLIITGKFPKTEKQKINNNNIFIDILEREEFSILNAIATAEGTIALAITNTYRNIDNSNILILGFGRIGKILADRLKALNANVYCTARKYSDFAWIESYGYKKISYEELDLKLNLFDIIINTVPIQLLDKEKINKIKKECLVIDLASYPGGIDLEFCKTQNIKAFLYLGIPGKVAPITSAEILLKTIKNIIKELNKQKGGIY